MSLTRKKVTAVLMSIVMAFVMVLGTVSITTSHAATTFTPRLSAPDSDNKYYYSSQNPFYACGYGMPNCTAYAYGRAYEILGSKPNLCTSSAYKWYDYNVEGGYYKYGSTPALGAIACWSRGSSGHVAVVEAISGSTITISESHYNGAVFDTTTITKGNESAYAGAFQGYIYILGNGAIATTTSTTSTSYKTGTYKVSTGSSDLNMRSGPGTSYSKVTSIPNGTTLNVTAVSGTWGKTTYNGSTGYVSLSYCVYQSSSSTSTSSSSSSSSSSTSSSSSSSSSTTSTSSLTYSKVVSQNGYMTGTYKVSTDGSSLNMRSGAGTSYSKVTSVPDGTSIYVTEVSGSWGKCTYNKKTGYVSLKYCDFYGLGKYDGTWYKFSNNKFQSYTGYTSNKNGTWKVTKGIVTMTDTGFYTYNNATYYVKNSKVMKNSTTLVKVDGTWYYIQNGKKSTFTGIVSYNGSKYYVKDGVCTLKYNGTVTYNGKKYTVKNSKVVS